METVVAEGIKREDELAGLKSPRRILVRFFKRSRDRWKARCQARGQESKRFRNRAADAARARDRWRQRAEAAEAAVERLRAELAAAQAKGVPAEGAQKKG